MSRHDKWAGVLLACVTGVLGAGLWAAPPEPISVFVSIEPQADFVMRIGGDRVRVEVLVGPGQSPATYSVNARQMAALSNAAVLFTIGVPFEKVLLPKLRSAVPGLRIVDTGKGIQRRQMEAHEHDDEAEHQAEHEHHQEHPGNEHSGEKHVHSGDDPHIWLDPMLVLIQARTIAGTLAELDPDGGEIFQANLAAFEQELKRLHAELTETLAPVRGKTLMVFHPAFGYFCDAYGLKQMAIEIQGKSPKARDLADLVRRAQAENVRVIFVQKQFSRKSADALAASIRGAVVAIDPLARDYIGNLTRMAEEVRKGLSQQQ